MRITINILLALLPVIGLRGGEEARPFNQKISHPPKVIGSTLILKSEFDVYRVEVGSRKNPTYFYKILPAPEAGIGGWEIAYLGRVPAGTKFKIIQIKKGKLFNKSTYSLKPLSPISQNLKGNTSRELVKIDADLDSQIFQLGSIYSNAPTYSKDTYADGTPKLNDVWFSIIDTNE